MAAATLATACSPEEHCLRNHAALLSKGPSTSARADIAATVQGLSM